MLPTTIRGWNFSVCPSYIFSTWVARLIRHVIMRLLIKKGVPLKSITSKAPLNITLPCKALWGFSFIFICMWLRLEVRRKNKVLKIVITVSIRLVVTTERLFRMLSRKITWCRTDNSNSVHAVLVCSLYIAKM